MLSIRMTRVGSKKKPYFRLVVTEGRSALQSSFVENLGTYNPRTKPAQVAINKDRVKYWLGKGAKPSDSVRTLLATHVTRDLSAVDAETPASAEATAARPAAQ
jgi:small subunit ribosomal protein S16